MPMPIRKHTKARKCTACPRLTREIVDGLCRSCLTRARALRTEQAIDRLPPVQNSRPVRQCSACPRLTREIRKGLCRACYTRSRRGSAAVGGSCFACSLADGRVLRSVRLATGDEVVACHNHGWLVERARPLPRDLAEAYTVAKIHAA